MLVINAILFCLILLLCLCFGCVGFLFGRNIKTKEEPKKEPIALTEEQERQIEKRKREEENFWNYNGDNQE